MRLTDPEKDEFKQFIDVSQEEARAKGVVTREVWTGNHVCENEWQSFRVKKDRAPELTSSEHEYPKKDKCRMAVKVTDIFGNDTTTEVEVTV